MATVWAKEMNMELKTLTPLWTGGVEKGKMDRIHETGIIGSLRWWFELFVRGLGGLVNDPTTDKRGGFDPEKYKKSTASDRRARLHDAGLCDASQVFGATGWRRRFRLLIQDSTSPDTSCGQNIRANRSYTDTRGNSRTPTWYFPGSPQSGSFTIQIQSTAQDFPQKVIDGLLQFMADWAAIGARAQMGFGVIEPVNGRLDTQLLYEWLIATAGNHQYPRLPSLQNIFLARIQLQNASDRDTFNLKYDLRQLFPGQQNRGLRHFIMGTVKGGCN
jgi:CRISPR-associated protein Cmr1